MKLILFYNKFFLYFIFFVNISFVTLALEKKNIENELKEITSKLRCMTCQNQTIYDSEADFSKDLKKIIRQKLNEGQSKREIVKFIEVRFGEFILFEPKFDKKNIFLWGFPFVIFGLSALVLLIKIKKNKKRE